MANDLNKSLYVGDEIDLKEIFKILIESKKILISTILIFIIASIIYSLSLEPSFKSSIKFEIGYIETLSGKKNLIEEPSEFISELKILLLKNPDNKLSQKVSMNILENKVIKMETTSSSVEKNENILNELISFIDERHSRLKKLKAEQKKNKISYDIESLQAKINFYTAKLSSKNQSKYLNIISNLEKEDQAIENLKLLAQNSSYTDQIFSLNQTLGYLRQNLKDLDSEVKVKSQIIGNIETDESKPKSPLIIFLGIFIGLITGILLIFINSFIKSYRES